MAALSLGVLIVGPLCWKGALSWGIGEKVGSSPGTEVPAGIGTGISRIVCRLERVRGWKLVPMAI